MRQPVAIGFYPGNSLQLENEVRRYLVSEKQINALGAILPHAGYSFSGPVAGATLKAAKTEKKVFTIFSPNHIGYGYNIAMSRDDWKTPLGVVKTDKEMIDKLKDSVQLDENAHLHEHSLEVQLPFLQVLYKDFTIVPICLSHLNFEDIEELSNAFDSNSFYIASSDFIHFGPNYGFVPIEGTIKEQLDWVIKKDNEMIELICKLEAKKFYDYVFENGYTVCGFVPITLLMLVMKRLGAVKGELIKHTTSYDTHKDSSFVSYAGIVFS